MHIFELGNCKDYREAGERVIEYAQVNIQKKSFEDFIKTSVPDLLSIPLRAFGNNGNWAQLTFKDSHLDFSSMKTIEYCKEFNETRFALLKATGVLEFSSGQIVEFPMTLTKVPFIDECAIINGSYKIIVSHLEPNNALHFNTYKDDNTLELKMKSMYSTFPHLIMTVNLKPKKDKALFEFRLVGRKIDANVGDYLINSLGYSMLEIPDITGDVLYSYINSTAKTTAINSDSISNALNKTNCSKYERRYLNEKLSYMSRAVGKYLADGTLITEEIAWSKQKEPKLYVKDEPNKNISGYYIYSNGFASLEFLLKDMGIDYNLEEDMFVHISTFNTLMAKYRNDIEKVLIENKKDLIKLILTKEDIVSLVNIFGHFIQGKVAKEDVYSLSDKILASVNDIYVGGMLDLLNIRIQKDFEDAIRKYYINDTYLSEDKVKIICNTIGSSNISSVRDEDNNKFNVLIQAINNYSQSDVFDNTSPFSEINHTRKLTSVHVEGRGGVKNSDSNLTPRMVHPTFMGRIDLNETSEGANVGLIRYLSAVALVNEERQILAPFFKVNNGIVDTSKAYFMTCEEEAKYTICLDSDVSLKDITTFKLFDKNNNIIKEITYDYAIEDSLIDYTGDNLCVEHDAVDFECITFKKNQILKDKVNVNKNNVQDFKSVDEVEYIITTPEHLMSVVSSANVFTNYNDNARILYASNQTRQGICVNKPDVPYVISKLTGKFTQLTGIEKSPIDGIVKVATNRKIVIQGSDNREYTIDLIDDLSTKENTILYSYPNVKIGDYVEKGQVITNTNMCKEGQVTNGVNLRVGIMPFYGLNFEDGIAISDRLVREGVLTSHHASTIEDSSISTKKRYVNTVEVLNTIELDFDKYPKSNPPIEINGIPCIYEKSKYDKLSTILNSDGSPKKRSVIQGDVLLAYFKLEEDKTGSSFSYRLKEVTYNEYSKAYISSVIRFEDTKNQCITYKIQLQHEELIEVGDKLSGRHGNKGVISKVVREMDMPYLEDGTRLDILLNPLGIPSRMNIGQVLELHFGEILRQTGYQIVLDNGVIYDKAKLIDLFSIYDGEIKQTVYDGITGLPYENKIAVGCSTVIKSKHQVSHKIHSRSSGKYNTYHSPTQGRANDGGQSLGYMELHAMAESGCSDILSELINYKSDKIEGRDAFKKLLSFGASNEDLETVGQIKEVDDKEAVDRSLSFSSKMMLARGIALLSYPEATDNGKDINVFTNKEIKRD